MKVGRMEEMKRNYKSLRQNVLLAFHKCLIRLLSLKVQVLENIYEIILMFVSPCILNMKWFVRAT